MTPSPIRISCLLAGVCLSAAGGWGQTTRPLTAAEELELRTLTGQLADASRSAVTRVEAAQLLLTRTYPQAAQVLREFLSDATNRGAQAAVAEAIVRAGQGPGEFIEPLMAMLTGEDAGVRAVAARALATYKDGGVTERLIAIAADTRSPQPVRLEVIASLQRVLDKSVVNALVGLLDDRDPAVVGAAADSLVRLTNIRTFGTDRERWKAWWRQNADKPRTEWLADLAESLARSASELERDNAQLRERLARAMDDLYAVTAPAQRDAMLLGLLKDALADVRLVGARITERRVGASEKTSPEIRAQVRGLLADPDVRVRQKAALLVSALAEPDAGKALLDRLEAEESPDVRKALLTALAQLADPAALPAIVKEIRQSPAELAAAAARALAKIAAKQPLPADRREPAVQALLDRSGQLASSGNGADLPEALLTAMGAIADERFLPELRGALGHKDAAVRLAAVTGLRPFGKADLAPALEAMIADPDRGVRQAVIAALGAMGGERNLDIILRRTAPAAELDPGVRQQAWDAVMAILAKADAETLARVVSGLSSRPDALDQSLRIQQMLVAALREAKSPQLPSALRRFGEDLVKADRPAEAASALGEAYAAFAAAKNAQAPEAWIQWVEALLQAGDPAVIKVMADQADATLFTEAAKRLMTQLEVLPEQSKWQEMVRLCSGALGSLKARLTAEQTERLGQNLADAEAKLRESDRRRVPVLVAQLGSADEPARKAAAAELQAMGDRAVAPLLAELKKSLQADNENRLLEAGVLGVLKQVAPRLVGYNASAPKADRLRVVEGWVEEWSRPPGG